MVLYFHWVLRLPESGSKSLLANLLTGSLAPGDHLVHFCQKDAAYIQLERDLLEEGEMDRQQPE